MNPESCHRCGKFTRKGENLCRYDCQKQGLEPGHRNHVARRVSNRMARKVWEYYTRMESTRPSLYSCAKAIGVVPSVVFYCVDYLEDLGYLQRETAHHATRTTGIRVLVPLIERRPE